MTDADGHYLIAGLGAGDVTVQCEGLRRAITLVSGHRSTADFRLGGSALQGRLRLRGAPAQGVVTLEGLDVAYKRHVRSEADAFAFEDVPAGTHLLTALLERPAGGPLPAVPHVLRVGADAPPLVLEASPFDVSVNVVGCAGPGELRLELLPPELTDASVRVGAVVADRSWSCAFPEAVELPSPGRYRVRLTLADGAYEGIRDVPAGAASLDVDARELVLAQEQRP
jgi:hypothetical protein